MNHIIYAIYIYIAYYTPKTGFQSVDKLYRKLKDKGITRNQIKDFILIKRFTNYINNNIKLQSFYL